MLQLNDMQKNDHILPAETLEPPSTSDTSIVLNGAGNGMMLGTLPFVVLELYEKITNHGKAIKKELPVAIHYGSLGMTVVGCAIGAVYGMHEAKQIRNYREGVSDQLSKLREQVAANTANIDSWTEKHDAEKAKATDNAHTR